ncbi:MAG: sugar porter family MFS transporter [Cyclobacteriaceae bacterium]|nr:sugar porter family MFS transporter [Cyclobacteriaceae bacterium]
MLANAGNSVTFGILAISSGIMFFFTLQYVPETKGKTLEEIEQLWD